MSISPKLSNSVPAASDFPSWHARHNRDRHAPDVIRQLICEHPYQVKFVIENLEDMEEARLYLAGFPEIAVERVLCMPQATTREQAEEFAKWLPGALPGIRLAVLSTATC